MESALAVLCERFADRTGLRITQRVAELPALSPEVELVVYRVAQEALTNVVRHSGAAEAELELERVGDLVTLTVRDQGRGLPAGHVAGTGMRGMRERATLIGADLMIAPESPPADAAFGSPCSWSTRGDTAEGAGATRR